MKQPTFNGKEFLPLSVITSGSGGNVKRGMTLNYYAHATFQSAQAEMARLEAAKVETTVVAAETTVENTEETKAAA